jgi:hypothetical protein
MRAMGGDAIPKELYMGFLDLFTAIHKKRVIVPSPRRSTSRKVN